MLKRNADDTDLITPLDMLQRMPFDVSHLAPVTNALMKEGFSDEEIGKMMGLNVVQLLQ